MSALSDRINGLEGAIEALEGSFDLAGARLELARLSGRVELAPGSDPTVFRDYGVLNSAVSEYQELHSSATFARDYAREILQAEATDEGDSRSAVEEIDACVDRVRNFVISRKLSGKHDEEDAIITLQSGVGGHQIAFFLDNLARAYTAYARRRGFGVEDMDEGDNSFAFRVDGPSAYGYFRGEHGVHRVIHVDRGSKRQTGYLTVVVEPKIEVPKLSVKSRDLTYEYLAATGPGGQNVNKTQSGVRITHKPTGISATARTRSQEHSKRAAEAVLYSRIARHYEQRTERPGERRVEPTRGNHFRTYHLPEGYIKDHRSGLRTARVDDFFSGDMNRFILANHGIREF